jgi:putative membrane protein
MDSKIEPDPALSIGTQTYLLNNWSEEEINRALGKNHPYRPIADRRLYGVIDDHKEIHNEPPPVRKQIDIDPMDNWFRMPLRAWVPFNNLEILAFFVIWNLVVVLITGNSNVCGDSSGYPRTQFCDQDYFFQNGALVNLLGASVIIFLAVRMHTALLQYNQTRCEWERLASACRNLVRQICYHVRVDSEKAAWERRRAMGFVAAVPATLKLELRHQRNAVPDLGNILVHQDILNMEKSASMPLFCVDTLNYYLVGNNSDGNFSNVALAMAEKSGLTPMVEALNALKRIRRTPTPVGYIVLLRSVIILWLLLYPLYLVTSYGYFTLLLAFIIDFIILSFESMTCQVETPLGCRGSDLDLDLFCAELYLDLNETLCRVENIDRDLLFDPWETARMNEEMIYKASSRDLQMLTARQRVTRQGRAQFVRNATRGFRMETKNSNTTDNSILSEA